MLRLVDLSPTHAAAALVGMAHLDPRGLASEADTLPMCETGKCVGIEMGDGAAVFVVHVRDGVAWISAARGTGAQDMTAAVHAAAWTLPGVRAVAFQTRRRGLVRKAQRLGYRITGYVMRKDAP